MTRIDATEHRLYSEISIQYTYAMISLLLGLGNIGRKYIGTRHNLGFELLDRVAAKLGASERRRTELFDWVKVDIRPSTSLGTAEGGLGTAGGGHGMSEKGESEELLGQGLILAWPRTYVNCSGDAAIKLLEDNGIRPSEMLALVDDFNLPLGALRFRSGGSDGGHNGLASLIETLGTEDFPRLRMGIGPVDKSTDIVDFVLSKFTASERKSADTML
ncbi:hypothetical protein C3F09_03005, partial [candidate division GN15 bacterium]